MTEIGAPRAGQPAETVGFAAELAALEARIEKLRQGEMVTADLNQVLVQDLETAREELRVADEEVRSQQDELTRLIQSQRTGRWQHERLIAVLPAPVVLTDPNGLIQTINAAAAALLRVRVDRALRKPVQAFIDQSDRTDVRRHLTTAVATQGEFRRVVTVHPRGTEPITVELVVTVARGAAGSPTEVTWLLLRAPAPVAAGAPPDMRSGMATALVELTQLPLQATDTREVLTRVTTIGERALAGRFAVSVCVGAPSYPEIMASSSKLAQNADGAQMLADEGSCLTAWETRQLVTTSDLSDDARWPKLLRYLDGSPLHAAVSSPVLVGDDVVGVLTAYSSATEAVDDQVIESVELLSTAVAAILHEIEVKAELEAMARQLQTALDSRPMIDQAKGVIMAQRRCTADEAFEFLVQTSSTKNVKLRDVANQIVEEVAGQGSVPPQRDQND